MVGPSIFVFELYQYTRCLFPHPRLRLGEVRGIVLLPHLVSQFGSGREITCNKLSELATAHVRYKVPVSKMVYYIEGGIAAPSGVDS